MFLDGPLEGKNNDSMFFGEWQRDLWYMPHPGGDEYPWILVGRDGMEPEVPWPKQVHYVRVDERSQLLTGMGPGEDEGWACYQLAS